MFTCRAPVWLAVVVLLLPQNATGTRAEASHILASDASAERRALDDAITETGSWAHLDPVVWPQPGPSSFVDGLRQFTVYVFVARRQNAWWTGIVSRFGGGCSDGCISPSRTEVSTNVYATNCTCRGESIRIASVEVHFVIKWLQTKVDEEAYMNQISREVTNPADVLVMGKYCSDNGGCNAVQPLGA